MRVRAAFLSCSIIRALCSFSSTRVRYIGALLYSTDATKLPSSTHPMLWCNSTSVWSLALIFSSSTRFTVPGDQMRDSLRSTSASTASCASLSLHLMKDPDQFGQYPACHRIDGCCIHQIRIDFATNMSDAAIVSYLVKGRKHPRNEDAETSVSRLARCLHAFKVATILPHVGRLRRLGGVGSRDKAVRNPIHAFAEFAAV
jgi:hypothetical protein